MQVWNGMHRIQAAQKRQAIYVCMVSRWGGDRMIDYADIIRQTVTMPQVLHTYGFSVGRFRRMPCPLHDGVKNNFAYKDRTYHCFVCGKSGGVIDFVMDFFHLSFQDAIRKMNTDFALGLEIDGNIPDEKQKELKRQAYLRWKERERRQNELKLLYTAYSAAYDKYVALDIIKMWDAPKGPYDEITPQYAYACQHIDAAWEEVQDAAERLREFEKKER